jgi:hypothetical protein
VDRIKNEGRIACVQWCIIGSLKVDSSIILHKKKRHAPSLLLLINYSSYTHPTQHNTRTFISFIHPYNTYTCYIASHFNFPSNFIFRYRLSHHHHHHYFQLQPISLFNNNNQNRKFRLHSLSFSLIAISLENPTLSLWSCSCRGSSSFNFDFDSWWTFLTSISSLDSHNHVVFVLEIQRSFFLGSTQVLIHNCLNFPHFYIIDKSFNYLICKFCFAML